MIRRPPRSTLFPTRRSSDLDFVRQAVGDSRAQVLQQQFDLQPPHALKTAHQLAQALVQAHFSGRRADGAELRVADERSEEHTSELQSRLHLVCRLLVEKKRIEPL